MEKNKAAADAIITPCLKRLTPKYSNLNILVIHIETGNVKNHYRERGRTRYLKTFLGRLFRKTTLPNYFKWGNFRN